MQITYVVPRYGATIAGGAEQLTRMFAERLAERGHEVSVLTSAATSYAAWDTDLPVGLTVENGVRVHRLATDPRDNETFTSIHARAATSWPGRRAALLDSEWSKAVGPDLPDLERALDRHTTDSDVLVAVPYMFTTTTTAMRWASGRVPTVLHPAAHDEPAVELTTVREIFRRADAFGFLTPEERSLTERLLGRTVVGDVVGIGFDDTVDAAAVPIPAIGDRPFILCLGRLDPGKGVHDLLSYFVQHHRRQRGDLCLVFAGDRVTELPTHDRVINLGYVDDDVRSTLLARCQALVQPSYFESFSMVLAEAWLRRRPVLVNGMNPVLAGQVTRARGGLMYRGYAEFEAALEIVVSDRRLATDLGGHGHDYVRATYAWPTVLERYEALLESARCTHHQRWRR